MIKSRIGMGARELILATWIVCVGGFSSAARAEIVTFSFAPVGSSFSAFLGAADPLVGREIVSARIYLNVESFAGSDAANFFTDLAFPVSPFPGNTNGLVILGGELGWSGAGLFSYFEETTLFNGVFIPARYGGETPGKGFDGILLPGSRIEFDVIPEPATFALFILGAVALLVARSRFRAASAPETP